MENGHSIDIKRKTAYMQSFATSYVDSFRPHYKMGETLGKGPEVWRNVSEHCLVAGVFADILAEGLALPQADRTTVVKAAILHDWNKKHETLQMRSVDNPVSLEMYLSVKEQADEQLRNLGIAEDIIALSDANISPTTRGPQTDSQKIIWYVDMMLANTDAVPIIERLDRVEAGWNGQYNDPERAATVRKFIDIFKPMYGGLDINQVNRMLVPQISQDFATRLGFLGDPQDLPYHLTSKLQERIAFFK